MEETIQKFFFGFFAVLALMIIFVRAGQSGKATGGQQTAQILNAGGSSLANLAKGLSGS
jgi:hypothetical protein